MLMCENVRNIIIRPKCPRKTPMRDAGLGDAFGNGVGRTKKKRRKFKWLFRRSRWRRCEYLTAGTATRTGTFQYPLYEGGG